MLGVFDGAANNHQLTRNHRTHGPLPSRSVGRTRLRKELLGWKGQTHPRYDGRWHAGLAGQLQACPGGVPRPRALALGVMPQSAQDLLSEMPPPLLW